VRCGATLEETTLAKISSPDWRTTPVARPFLRGFGRRVLDTDFDSGFAAASAMALEIAPVPPRLKPQERNAPSISPM